MLDLDNKVTLFNIEFPKTDVRNNILVMSGVNAFLSNSKPVYSELDELNFSMLNSNDYGLSSLHIEFCFENSFTDPYFEFYAGCFSIRTDEGVINKLNGFPYEKCFSKVNMNNKVVVGILYYFRNKDEIKLVENCNMFCSEGCIAIGKKNNIYDLMCRLIKKNGVWQVIDANTYRIHKKQSIVYLAH